MRMTHFLRIVRLLLFFQFVFYISSAQYVQTGPKLTGTGGTGNCRQGTDVAISADSSTLVSGAPLATVNGYSGGAWVFVRQDSTWIQQALLAGSNAIGVSRQGVSVAVSADGNTVLVGGSIDNDSTGAVWVFVRNGTTWTEQAKLVSSNVTAPALQGSSVSISYDGNTALIGAPADNGNMGAALVFVRTGTVWAEQAKLVGTGNSGPAMQGKLVSISADGNTAASGGGRDSSDIGAVWIFERNGTVWTQNGGKIVAPYAWPFGSSFWDKGVALSGNGLMLAVGSPTSASYGSVSIYEKQGGSWVYDTTVASANYFSNGTYAAMGQRIALSYNGSTMVFSDPRDYYVSGTTYGRVYVFEKNNGAWTETYYNSLFPDRIGGSYLKSVAINANGGMVVFGSWHDRENVGACWVCKKSFTTWSVMGSKIVGTGDNGPPALGTSLAISANGKKIVTGGTVDNGSSGAYWTFTNNAGVWSQQGNKTTGTPDHPGNRFGKALGMSADGSTVAALGYDLLVHYSSTSGLWMFKDSAGAWQQQGNPLDMYTGISSYSTGGGAAISDDGSTVIFSNMDANVDSGVSKVFVKSGNNWVQQGTLVGNGGKYKGWSVAISESGDVAAVGSYNDSTAFIFRRTGGVWNEEYKITKKVTNPAISYNAVSLSNDGNTMALGVTGDSSWYGAVYIYTYDGSNWTEQAKIRGTGATTNPWFGYSVALSGDGNTLACGGPNDGAFSNIGQNPLVAQNGSGAFWVYKRNGTNWIQYGNKLIPSDTAVYTTNDFNGGSLVGSSVAITTDGYTIATSGNKDNYSNGAVWVYEFTGMRIVTDTVIHPTCDNSGDGKIVVHGSGGQTPYSYHWSVIGAPNSDTLTGLSAGYYYLTVTDAVGDSSTMIYGLHPTGGNMQVTSDVLAQCGSAHTGEVTLHINGGVTPYQYNWSTSPTDTDSTIKNLGAGTYLYTITDAGGCIMSGNATVPYNVIWTTSTVARANCGSNTGSAGINIGGGVAPFTYLWSTTPPQITPQISGLASGTYYFTATDSYGCSTTGNVQIDSTCNNVIRGNVYYDLNNNCVQDLGEPGVPNCLVRATSPSSSRYGTANSLGSYQIYLDTPGTYSISYGNFDDSCFNITPCQVSNNVSFTGLGDTVDYNVSLGVAVGYDLDVSLTATLPRPGFNFEFSIRYENLLPVALSSNATITLNYDSHLVYVSSGTPFTSHNTANHTITWNVPVTGVNAGIINSVVFTVPVNVSVGTILFNNLSIEPDTLDCNLSNNSLELPLTVTGSFDPNTKECFPDSVIGEGDSVLTYTIHFQNTGNDTTRFIIVKDTLSQYVEPETVRTIATSLNPYNMEISEGGILTWIFAPAFLPDSATDPINSIGFLSYTVKLDDNLTNGIVVNNRASIYFDYNAPVITNTTNTTISINTGITNLPTAAASFSLYPNPATNSVTISIPESLIGSTATVSDVMGRVVAAVHLSTVNRQLSTDDLSSGIYLITIGNRTQKLIITK